MCCATAFMYVHVYTFIYTYVYVCIYMHTYACKKPSWGGGRTSQRRQTQKRRTCMRSNVEIIRIHTIQCNRQTDNSSCAKCVRLVLLLSAAAVARWPRSLRPVVAVSVELGRIESLSKGICRSGSLSPCPVRDSCVWPGETSCKRM